MLCRPGSWLVILASVVLTVSAGCPAAISLAIQNVTLPQNGLFRGVAFPVGTPSQTLALNADSNANNTYVSAVGASCPAGRAPARCAAESGGQFNDLTSSTVSQLMGVSESGASLEPLYNVNDSFWRKDVVQIDGIYPITDMPIGMLDYGRGAIGLSKNSSILSKLSTASIIPSRSYALWWGLQGAEQEDQMDGSVVLGGYDRAKTKGKNLTQPLSPSSSQCPSGISVDVTSFRLRSKDGWSADLLGDSKMTSFPTCIDMTLPINTVPSGPWQTLLNITRFQLGQPDLGMYDWWGTELLGNNSYDGDLVLTLSDALTVTIPNKQLIVPMRDTDASSGRPMLAANGSQIVRLGPAGTSPEVVAQLGRIFLSAVYLHVNHERREWTMWEANPTTNQNLVAVSGTGLNTSCSLTGDGTASPVPNSPGSSGSTSANASGTPSTAQTLSTGAILGIVTGILAAAVLTAFFALFLRRRRRNRTDASAPPPQLYPAHLSFAPPPTSPSARGSKRFMRFSTKELGPEGEVPSARELAANRAFSEAPEGNARFEVGAGVRHTAYFPGGVPLPPPPVSPLSALVPPQEMGATQVQDRGPGAGQQGLQGQSGGQRPGPPMYEPVRHPGAELDEGGYGPSELPAYTRYSSMTVERSAFGASREGRSPDR